MEGGRPSLDAGSATAIPLPHVKTDTPPTAPSIVATEWDRPQFHAIESTCNAGRFRVLRVAQATKHHNPVLSLGLCGIHGFVGLR